MEKMNMAGKPKADAPPKEEIKKPAPADPHAEHDHDHNAPAAPSEHAEHQH
jgi:hypothetical protein